jgi:glycine dehydrogenase subunit 1
MPFISNTPAQQAEMLADIGLTLEGLFGDIPNTVRCGPLDLPEPLSELELTSHMGQLARKNAEELTCFIGGGFYDHFIPSAVPALVSRSEFYTAYTPYQPELAQGTLQVMYEFQSAICRLTGMEVSNASLYDGGTALYEAMMMSLRVTGRNKIIVDTSVNPIYRKMLQSYTTNLHIELIETTSSDGLANREALFDLIDYKTAAVIIQNPNFFGCIDDVTDIGEKVHDVGGLLVMSAYPIALGILKTPAEMDVDIVVGEGQSLGIPMSFGGPYVGFMATRKKYVRKMPGRIAGITSDRNGKDGFVLTLQAREQHIRRAKAMSNICTNQGLLALTATIYMGLMGREGLKEVSHQCADKACYAFRRLTDIDGVVAKFPNKWFFNEFVLELPCNAADVIGKLIEQGIAAGFPLSRYYEGMDNCMLIAVTEKRTKQEIGHLAEALEGLL